MRIVGDLGLKDVMDWCRKHPQVSYWTAWSLLGASITCAYFTRRRVRDRESIKIIPVTPTDHLYQLVRPSQNGTLIVKVKGRVATSRSIESPISGTKCTIYLESQTFSFSSREGVAPMFKIQDAQPTTSNVRVCPKLCRDTIGGRYFYLQKVPIWRIEAPFLIRVWRFFGLQREYVLPINTEILIVAEARVTASREVVLQVPHEFPDSMWLSRRRALTYFITCLSEEQLVQAIERKAFIWAAACLTSFLSGYSLMITRHQAITGRGPAEPLMWGAIQLVAASVMCFWLQEEQIRSLEHRFTITRWIVAIR
eukprot:GEMP01048490.1.p1 GENE.GEMP01048490.1~~GEMP01048490.1.p1  ORF type:complete len:310 (-),score=28.34 GEMP01048490.1:716-1645(-)